MTALFDLEERNPHQGPPVADLLKSYRQAPDPFRAQRDALTIGASYIVGGLIPLAPYMLLSNVITALWGSVGVTLTALFVFGYVKGRFTEINPLRGGLQTVLVGGLAAAAAFTIARMIG